MIEPPTEPGVQPHQPKPQPGSPAEQRAGANPLPRPHAAQLGRVDAVGPPSAEHPKPAPPLWLRQALSKLQLAYPDDVFEGTMRYTAVSTATDTPMRLDATGASPPDATFMYYPRINCLDCPGRMYAPGPGTGTKNFEIHVKNRRHREMVEGRVRDEGGRVKLEDAKA